MFSFRVDIFSVQKDFLTGDPTVEIGDLLQTGDLAVLMSLHGLDIVGRVDQALVGAGVEPGEALTEQLHIEGVILEVDAVEIGDLQLASGGGREVFRVFHDLVVVEIQSRHAVIGLRLLRLFLDGDDLAVLVEFHDAEALRIVDIVAEHRGALAVCRVLDRRLQALFETVTGKNIVAEHHGDAVVADEIRADDERLRESVGRRLDGVGQAQTELFAVAEQLLKARRVLRCGNDEDIPDPGAHEHRHGIVDHRFVIDRQQLLGGHLCQRIQARAGAACENNTFHIIKSSLISKLRQNTA